MLTLRLIASYLTLGADPPGPTPPADPPVAAAPPDDLDLPPDEPPADPPDPPAGDPDDAETIRRELAAEKAARTAAETREREAAERLAKVERERAAPPPGPSREQQQFEAEEKRLRELDLSTKEGRDEKWQIESNRVLRDTQRDAAQARFQAQDAADKAEFDRLVASEPRFKKFVPEVEKILSEARASGMNPKRDFLLDIAIGKAVRGAKREAPKPKPPVERGKPASARSDVRAGARKPSTAAQRLDGVII